MSINIQVPDVSNYGFPLFTPDWPQVNRELYAYCLLRGNYGKDLQLKLGINPSDFGFQSVEQHLANAMMLLWPNNMDFKVRRYVNRNLLRILECWCHNNDIGLAGSASSGKTYNLAGCIVGDWLAAPHCTLSIVATTSLRAGEDRIFGSITSLYKNASVRIGTLVDHKGVIVFENVDPDKASDEIREYRNAIKAIAIPRGQEGKTVCDNTRGRKNGRVRLIYDELPEMELYTLDTKSNLMGGNRDVVFAGIGNPLPGRNPHTELCKPDNPLGYDSITEDTEEWKTRTGIALFFHGLRNPNFDAPPDEPPPFPYLLTREGVETMTKNAYGNENSLELYRNKVGFWAKGNIETTVLSKDLIRAKQVSGEPEWSIYRESYIVSALDPAFSINGDRSCAGFIKVGYTKEGKQVAHYLFTKTYFPEVDKIYDEQIAEQWVNDCIALGIKPDFTGLDISMDGGRMLQSVAKEWQSRGFDGLSIHAISSTGNPTERTVSSEDSRKCSEAYDRKVTEYWFAMRVAILTRCIFGIDIQSSMVDELCARKFTFKNKKASIETKEDLKEILKKSPDEADAAVYALEIARLKGLIFTGDDTFMKAATRERQEEIDKFMTSSRGSRFAPVGGDGDTAYQSDDWGE